MLRTNQLTDIIQRSVDRKDCEFGIQSIDASADGKKALLLGIFEDPDFPEIFIYSAKTGKARRVNHEGAFIDVPLGKAFWAENGRDFYIKRHDCDTLYRVELDSKSYKICDFQEIRSRSEYIEAKARQVRDFFRDADDCGELVVAPAFENDYHQFSVGLVSELETNILAAVSYCQLSRMNPDPEVLKRRANDALLYLESIFHGIEQLKQGLSVSLDTSGIKAGLETLREMSGLPPDEVPL